jgi:hypothetical protein
MIYIGFSKPINRIFPIMSWLIRLVERTEYSHVYIKMPSSNGNYFIYQASGTQVNIVGSKHFEHLNKPVKEYALQISAQQRRDLLLFMAQECGAPYSVAQIINIFVYMITGKAFLKPKGYVCSELAGIVLSQYLNIKLEKDLDLVTPKDIEMLLEQKR